MEEGEESSHQMRTTLKSKIKNDEKVSKIFELAKDSNKEIWGKETLHQNIHIDDVPIGSFEVFDSSIKGYGVKWMESAQKVKIGEIFGVLADDDKRVEIGLIRKIRASSDAEIRLGIELIGLESKAVCMSSPGLEEQSTWALFLPGVKGLNQADSVIYSSSDFHPGEFVCLKEDGKKTQCRLTKILHSTSAISHVELFYPKM